ncbi:MAG: hypothetical protein ACLTTO_09030 [Lachnospiraceae bacterium]
MHLPESHNNMDLILIFSSPYVYTIKGSNGKLIVIDGGWDYDAKRVMRYHKETGRKGNLIITHPHPTASELSIRFCQSGRHARFDQVIAPKINASRYRDTINIHGMNIRYFRSFHVL